LSQDVQFIENIDEATQESLASRVCRSDGSLILSDQQVSAYGALVDYLNEDGEGYHGIGLLAGAVCVFMWIITVAKELDTVWNEIAAIVLELRSNPMRDRHQIEHTRNAQLAPRSSRRPRQVLLAHLYAWNDS
jgi:hypothetical protein